jgi:hypothetical protein
MVPIRPYQDPPVLSSGIFVPAAAGEATVSRPEMLDTDFPCRLPTASELQDIPELDYSPRPAPLSRSFARSLIRVPVLAASGGLNITSLILLISLVAAIPLLQFISLGYLLFAASRLADGMPWRKALPGLQMAGRIGIFIFIAALLYLPVLLLFDLAYSAELLLPGSPTSKLWRLSSAVAWMSWSFHVTWAAARGGRWWHLFWPAPVQFFQEGLSLTFWRRAWERFYQFLLQLQLTKLWWLGARATVAALLFLAIPVSLMILGQRAEDLDISPLLGILGATGMVGVMFTLPFLQVEFARQGKLNSFLQFRSVRQRFLVAPMAHTIALLSLCLLAIPLYLLRIEATPSEILWMPTIFFAALMLPAKLLIGWAIGRGHRRLLAGKAKSPWWIRFPCRFVGLAGVLVYVASLYLAQLIAGQGAWVMYFQHAFLVPNPLFVT